MLTVNSEGNHGHRQGSEHQSSDLTGAEKYIFMELERVDGSNQAHKQSIGEYEMPWLQNNFDKETSDMDSF